MVYDHEKLDYPGFAPFTAAGYFVAHSDFLREVPFDPFLPWIFMVRKNGNNNASDHKNVYCYSSYSLLA
jgi:hypothetical protein